MIHKTFTRVHIYSAVSHNVAPLLLFCDGRGTYFTCDRLVIDEVVHNVQYEWYASTLILVNVIMQFHYYC